MVQLNRGEWGLVVGLAVPDGTSTAPLMSSLIFWDSPSTDTVRAPSTGSAQMLYDGVEAKDGADNMKICIQKTQVPFSHRTGWNSLTPTKIVPLISKKGTVFIFLLQILVEVFASPTVMAQGELYEELPFESRQPQPSEWINLFDAPDKVWELDLASYGLFTLNRMTSNGDGWLAFLDYEDEQIVLLNARNVTEWSPKTDDLFKKIGHGIGNSPSQFGNTFDVKFTSAEELIVTDIMHARLSKWNRSGKFLGVMSFEDIVPSRITVCPDGTLYLLLQNYTRKGMIARVNPKDGRVENVFQRVNRFDLQSVFHRDGSMTCHGSDLLYAAYYFDFLKRYAPNGDVTYSRTLTGFTPNEKLIEQGENELGAYIRRSPSARRSVGELYLHEGLLFAGFSGNSDSILRRLDLYDPVSGFYLGTIPMEEPFEEFVIDKTGIYVLTSPTDTKPPRIIHYEWEGSKRAPRTKPIQSRDLKKEESQSTDSGKTSSNP